MAGDERGGGIDGGPGAPDAPRDAADGVVGLDDEAFSTPSCPSCIRRMEPASTSSGAVYWSCVHCGQTRLA